MGFQISVEGAFQLSPVADDAARTRVSAEGGGWAVSPNGRLLYLADDERPAAFDALRHLVQVVLPALGLTASGSLDWCGEDGAGGQVSIDPGGVHVEEDEEERLSEVEVARHVARLASGTTAERIQSADLFEAFHARSAQVVHALGRQLSDEDLDVRLKVAKVLASFGPAAAPAVDALIRALDDAEPWMQAAAAEALGAIGPRAAAAAPALERLTRHPSYGPAGRAREALGRIGS